MSTRLLRYLLCACAGLMVPPGVGPAGEMKMPAEPLPSLESMENLSTQPWHGTALEEVVDPCLDCIPLPRRDFELQVLSGAGFDNSIGPGNRPDWVANLPKFSFDYAPIVVRFSADWLLPRFLTPGPESHLQWLGEGLVAPIFDGPGGFIGGPSFLLRLNYTDRASRIIPYTQGGAGIVFTDAYHDSQQRAIGQAMEFLLQVGAGLRVRINESWTLDAEVAFQHISNARTAKRNGGVNANVFFIGATYSFPR